MFTLVLALFSLTGFWVPSGLMGWGIAIDVAIATVAKFNDRTLSFKNWTLPIMATHIGFPAIGYYLFWGLGEKFAFLSPILGVVGFFFVAAFIYEVICKKVGVEPVFGISAWISGVMGLREDDSRRFIAILAVSWDALWSGPAKAAQALAGHWTRLEVILSFVVAGITVAVVAQLSLLAARWLQEKEFHSAEQMAWWFFWGTYVELSVIGGFGNLSLSEAIFKTGNLYLSIGVAALILLGLWRKFRKEIFNTSLEEAEDAIQGQVEPIAASAPDYCQCRHPRILVDGNCGYCTRPVPA